MNISVVVPAYNEEKVIERCLRALKDQTLKPAEIIVGDGGSTDRTVQIAGKYGKVVIDKRRGIARGRNAGGFAAHGDIICFTDADCVPAKDWLENIARSFRPGVVLAAGSVRPMTRSRLTKLAYALTFRGLAPLLFKIGKPMTAGWNISCTREAFRKINGFNADMTTAEDLDLLLRLSKLGKSVYNSDAIVHVSTRREEEYGLLRLALFHLKNGLNFVFFRRSAGFYPDVR